MANLYASFIDCLNAQAAGTFTKDMVDYPTVADGVDGVQYVAACLKSQAAGNTWVEM